MVAHFATSTTIYICLHLAFGYKCHDSIEKTHEYEGFTPGGLDYGSGKMNNGSCLQFCLDNINCVAAVEDTQSRSCKYSETLKVRGVRPLNVYNHVTFYRVNYRCPIHYSCDELPCQNGSTCEVIKSNGQFGSTKKGSKCHCANGYKGWFCKEMYTCADNMCLHQGKCSMPTGTNGLIQCTCDPKYTGFYCNETAPTIAPTNSTGMTRKTKTVIAIVGTTVLAAGAIGATASAVGATTAAATTAGGAAATGTAAG